MFPFQPGTPWPVQPTLFPRRKLEITSVRPSLLSTKEEKRRRNEHEPMSFPRHEPRYMIRDRKRASKPSPRDYPTSPSEKVCNRLVGIVPLLLLVCPQPSIAVIVIGLLGPSSAPRVVPSCRPMFAAKEGARSTTRKDRRSVFHMYSTIAIRCLWIHNNGFRAASQSDSLASQTGRATSGLTGCRGEKSRSRCQTHMIDNQR
jgi:hypothetical protein